MGFQITGYHGTCWEIPLIPSRAELQQAAFMDGLDIGRSELGALFFADDPRVADVFAEIRQANPETQVQVMLEARLDCDRVYHADFRVAEPVVDLEGVRYRIPEERAALHRELARQGYDAFVMLGDYRVGRSAVDDVAVLNPACVRITGVRLRLEEAWSPRLSRAEALAQFHQWCRVKQPGFDECLAGVEPAPVFEF